MSKTKLKSNLPMPRLLWLFIVAGLVWGINSATAQINTSNAATVNITPSGFSVVWPNSLTGAAQGTPSIAVFSDSAGHNNLAGQLGIDYFPIHTGDPALTNSYDRRLNQAALRLKTSELGLAEAKVSGCAPNTTYYYQLQKTDSKGHQTVWPTSGALPAVTTAVANSFVVQSLQLVLDVPGLDPSGSIVILSNSNTPSLLAAVAGDGVSSNQVYFNLSDLLAASGTTNFLPLGLQEFTAVVLGPSNTVSQTYALNFTTSFLVGQGSQYTLGSYVNVDIGSAVIRSGSSGSIPISVNASSVTNITFTLDIPTNRFSSLTVQPLLSQVSSATIKSVGSNTLQVTLTAGFGQNLSGNLQLAQLNFTTASNQSSAFVPFSPLSLSGINADASTVSNLAALPGRVVIVGKEPLLETTTVSPGVRSLSLYGIVGTSYAIQESTNLASARSWTDLMRVPMTNLLEIISGLDTGKPAVFYRAYQFQADPPVLEAHMNNQNRSVLVYGLSGTNYTLQYATTMSGTVAWHPLLNYTLTNSFQTITNIGNTSPIFYRVAKP